MKSLWPPIEQNAPNMSMIHDMLGWISVHDDVSLALYGEGNVLSIVLKMCRVHLSFYFVVFLSLNLFYIIFEAL